MELKTAEIDGKLVAFHEHTSFLVQLGKGKSSYKTKYRFVGNLRQAVQYYCSLNVGNGYKKRLYMEGAKNPVIAKEVTYA